MKVKPLHTSSVQLVDVVWLQVVVGLVVVEHLVDACVLPTVNRYDRYDRKANSTAPSGIGALHRGA